MQINDYKSRKGAYNTFISYNVYIAENIHVINFPFPLYQLYSRQYQLINKAKYTLSDINMKGTCFSKLYCIFTQIITQAYWSWGKTGYSKTLSVIWINMHWWYMLNNIDLPDIFTHCMDCNHWYMNGTSMTLFEHLFFVKPDNKYTLFITWLASTK